MSSTPQKIGRFEIRGELGRGMMGVVYEAHDPVLTRTVALKTVNPAYAETVDDLEAFERRFESEARVAARLSHPNIVVVHDVGREAGSGTLYIALEHLLGESLAQVLRRGERLAWRQVLDVGRQLADALDHAHGQGVVHRDIKPSNVMLLPSGQAKLTDFGIAKLDAARLTATGQLLGTPLFMCPEQASNEPVDGRGDIFSLGSLLYTLLTGRDAFAAATIPVIVYRVVHVDPPAPSTIDPSLPADVDMVLARCLAKRPADRYPDAAHLSRDLADVLEGRPPRHARGTHCLPPASGPVEGLPDRVPRPSSPAPGAPSHAGAAPTRTLTATPRPERRASWRGRRWLGVLAAIWVTVLALALVLPERPSLSWLLGGFSEDEAASAFAEPRAQPSAVPTPASARPPMLEPAPTPEPTPEPTPPPATIVVDFRHPLRACRLRVWMDGDEVLGQRVRGDVSKDLLLVKVHSGTFTDILEVPAGRHRFRVDVGWDDEQRSERIPGLVHSGETYRLEIRLGRIKKNLSLNWTR